MQRPGISAAPIQLLAKGNQEKMAKSVSSLRGAAALTLVLLATSAAGEPSAERDVRVEETVIQYYDVRGSTADQLRTAMRTYGPTTSADIGKHYFAVCRWYLKWRARYRTAGGQCGIDTLQLDLSATIEFPKWSTPESGTPALRDKWGQMTTALRHHEDGHKDNGVRAANDLARRLHALPAQSDCKTLEQQINANLDQVLKQYRELDQTYDRETSHGATQGATLN
jgi:predicted secreted Zn-dependent protease